MSKKIRNEIRLNETNKKDCGVVNSLCEEYKDLKNQIDELSKDFELVKSKLKDRFKVDADIITNEYKIVMSLIPSKEEFKYNMDKVLKAYPEIENNPAFGEVKTKAEVQTLKSVEKL